MADDTRDIAIKADASAAAGHHRLDKMNGSIDRLGESHEKMREDFALRNEKLVEDFSVTTIKLVRDIATIKTTLSNTLKVTAAVVSLVVAIAAGVIVYAITHIHHADPTRPALTSSN